MARTATTGCPAPLPLRLDRGEGKGEVSKSAAAAQGQRQLRLPFDSSFDIRASPFASPPPYKGRIYDPACGSGGMFVQSVKFLESHDGTAMRDSAKPNSEASLREFCEAKHHRGDISIYGQESNSTTRRLAIMNLAIRGIEADIGKEHADIIGNSYEYLLGKFLEVTDHSTDKAAVHRDLFRALLRELMTAKTRIHELEIPA